MPCLLLFCSSKELAVGGSTRTGGSTPVWARLSDRYCMHVWLLADCDAAVKCEGDAQLQACAGPPSGAALDMRSAGESLAASKFKSRLQDSRVAWRPLGTLAVCLH